MKKLLIVNPRSMNSQMSYVHHLNYFSRNTSIESYLVCETADSRLLDKNICIIEVPRNGSRLLFAIKLYKRAATLIIENRINCVISCYGHFNCLLVLFLLKAKYTKQWTGTLFYDLRSASVSGVVDRLQNIMFRFESLFYDQRIAVTKETAIKVFGLKKGSKCFILGPGTFSRREFENSPSVKEHLSQVKKQYNIDENTLVLVYIGTLLNRKLDKFIELFNFDDKNYSFFIIGDGDIGSETKIKSLVDKSNLSSNIHLLGRLPYYELPVYLLLADVGIAYAPKHDSLNSQPFTKIHEYSEFEVLVLASDNLSDNQFANNAEIVYLSEYKSISKLRNRMDLKQDTFYKNREKPVYWEDLSKKFYQFINKPEDFLNSRL